MNSTTYFYSREEEKFLLFTANLSNCSEFLDDSEINIRLVLKKSVSRGIAQETDEYIQCPYRLEHQQIFFHPSDLAESFGSACRVIQIGQYRMEVPVALIRNETAWHLG